MRDTAIYANARSTSSWADGGDEAQIARAGLAARDAGDPGAGIRCHAGRRLIFWPPNLSAVRWPSGPKSSRSIPSTRWYQDGGDLDVDFTFSNDVVDAVDGEAHLFRGRRRNHGPCRPSRQMPGNPRLRCARPPPCRARHIRAPRPFGCSPARAGPPGRRRFRDRSRHISGTRRGPHFERLPLASMMSDAPGRAGIRRHSCPCVRPWSGRSCRSPFRSGVLAGPA